jgi:MerR family mercuric resistance operon transcriptional regulator
MNAGRTGSKAASVASQAPPIPRLSNIKGTTQHKLAPIPARMLATKVCFEFMMNTFFSSDSYIIRTVPMYGGKLMAQKNFTIGVLAKNAGVNVETIRFYQRRGLLAEPIKPFKGIRHYAEQDVQRVQFIKQGQKLGFSLDEIAELLSLEEGRCCQEAREIAHRKLAFIHERIESLRMMEAALSNLVESCATNTDSISCPIINTLLKTSA